MIKITIRAEIDGNWKHSTGEDFHEKLSEFRQDFERRFDQVLPAGIASADFRPANFPTLLQRMLRVAAEQAFQGTTETAFQPLSSVTYSDGVRMLSLTGLICRANNIRETRQRAKEWKFGNADWEEPHRIDLPVLSVKERLLLEKHLPTKANTGRALSKALGYWVDDSEEKHLRKLQQYADFYRYYPHFAKVTI